MAAAGLFMRHAKSAAMKMLFPALPGLLLIASGIWHCRTTLLPVAPENSRDVMLLWAIHCFKNDLRTRERIEQR
ncbi:hypothetical protein KCP75_07770 [Salmonella enterica subsp. enterica]|nr:hypothetical protein KCP75_07770 [Salmonella enterica subsp. enterica]